MGINKLFGKNLKRIRESKGYTQQELAELCDMQTNSIGVIEIGQRAVSFATLELLAEKLDVNYYDFFTVYNNEEPVKEKLIEDLNREVSGLDNTVIEHMITYAKSVKKLVKNIKKSN
nr:MAG TPA: helix-turn-helix domain protein [Caudoviricetes sp.]